MNKLKTNLHGSTRKKTFPLILGLVFLICACGSDDETGPAADNLGEFNAKALMHDGVERDYHVYLPRNFDKADANAMVIALHGGSDTAINFATVISGGTLTAAAESNGVVIVAPQGIDKRWNSGRPEIFNGETSYDDVGFISTLIDTMISDYNIDASRVYATGISNGGFMSVRLALDIPEKLAAVAPVTAQMSKAVETKVPDFPISIMIVNGTEDPIIPYDGGHVRLSPMGPSRGEILSTQETIDKFRDFNQCTATAETQMLPDGLPDDGTQVEITKYTECTAGTEVVLVKVIGGGHTWPSGAQYLPASRVGVVSQEINTGEMIFDFLLAHSRN